MQKKAKVRSSASSKNSILTFEQKKRIAGLLLIAFSIFLLLSIATYSQDDNRLTLSNLFDHEPVKNWLGAIGALLAKFFILSVLGYFSIVFPFMLFFLGLSLIIKINYGRVVFVFNVALITVIIVAASFGVFKAKGYLLDVNEFSGAVGNYLGLFLSNLLGMTGSIIILVCCFLILLVAGFNVNISAIAEFFRNMFVKIFQSFKSNYDEFSADRNTGPELKKENLKKIKEIREEKQKKKIQSVPVEEEIADDYEEELEKETTIRINKKELQAKEEKLNKQKKRFEPISEPVVEEINEVEEPDQGVKSEVEFPEVDSEKERLLPDQWDEKINYTPLSFDLLDEPEVEDYKVAEEELTRNAQLLKEKLKLFDIAIEDIEVTPGPVVTLYEIKPAPGVKISKIVNLEHDIALALAARGIRIIAPIPGKSVIGVEIPNATSAIVKAKSVLRSIRESKLELPLALGKQINGDIYLTDLAKMPHLLIAGSTGSGKSVGINMIIGSLLYSKHPSEVKLIMIDPKKIELSFYNKLRSHYLAKSPDLNEDIITEPQNAVLCLKAVELEMEKRYDMLAKAGARNIIEYNKKLEDPVRKPKDTDKVKHHYIPYIIVIIDELADLMITAGKEVEEPITRLAQLARAVGIHLVVATQRPSVNVITGVIKANFSARIAYQVATKVDSRTILDMNGAEQLLGRGDMLFLPTGQPKPIRIQNAYISTEEVEVITDEIKKQQGYSKPYFLPSIYEKKKEAGKGFLTDLDPMFEEAAKVIVRHQQGSVSLLQRRLKLGYSRAARIVDQLEEAGIVGPNDGSKAREVIVENEEQLETILRNL
ncbi:MAG TPA: DNA translocase FtsK [Ignavibacteriaceae bacterium]|nr:DNA translocase FtsK [Ignavibacteriaceae bacterium]